MSDKFKNSAQFELFPETTSKNKEVKKVRYLLKDLTLSVENIIVLSIILVMTLVVFFSYGVERGKKRIVGNDEKIEGLEMVSKVIEKKVGIPLVEETKKLDRIEVLNSGEKIESIVDLEKETSFDVFFEEEVLKEEKEIIDAGFTIQVASFKLEKNAKKEALRLKDKGHNTFVVPKGDYSIVCVGKFVEKIQAQKFSYKLKDRYRDLLVRRF